MLKNNRAEQTKEKARRTVPLLASSSDNTTAGWLCRHARSAINYIGDLTFGHHAQLFSGNILDTFGPLQSGLLFLQDRHFRPNLSDITLTLFQLC